LNFEEKNKIHVARATIVVYGKNNNYIKMVEAQLKGDKLVV
jgi:hypothetical protein